MSKANGIDHLLADVVDGQNRALAVFMQQIRPKLVATALRLLHNLDDAQDVAQETLRRAFSETRLFEPGFNREAWAHRVARNLCFNAIRNSRRRYHRLELYGATVPAIVPAEPSAEAVIVAHEEREELERKLDTLTQDHQEILNLRYRGEMSYDEIVRHLDLPIGTVMSRIHRAHKRLHQAVVG